MFWYTPMRILKQIYLHTDVVNRTIHNKLKIKTNVFSSLSSAFIAAFYCPVVTNNTVSIQRTPSYPNCRDARALNIPYIRKCKPAAAQTC